MSGFVSGKDATLSQQGGYLTATTFVIGKLAENLSGHLSPKLNHSLELALHGGGR